MTTTPTLYVKGYYTRFGSQLPDGSYNATDVPTARPATHDELIAAMPRCGTCERWTLIDDTTTRFCMQGHGYPRKTFGCTEHKERV